MSDDEKEDSLTKLKKLGKVEEKRMKDLEEDTKGPTFGSQEIDEVNPSSSEIGKGDNKKPSKDGSDSSNVK